MPRLPTRRSRRGARLRLGGEEDGGDQVRVQRAGGDHGLFGPGKMVAEFDTVLFPEGGEAPPPSDGEEEHGDDGKLFRIFSRQTVDTRRITIILIGVVG